MSVISQLLLNRFWQNFKHRFLGPSWTDSKCQSNICTGNICSCDICPYQEYLSLYWAVFDQTLKVSSWDHLRHMPAVMVTFVQATFVLATFVHSTNISPVTDPYFWEPQFLEAIASLEVTSSVTHVTFFQKYSVRQNSSSELLLIC